MPAPTNAQYQEVAILTRAVENVFRKLVRFLVGRISLVKLQEMIGYIYVQEAENQISEEFVGKRIPLTKLALLTGLDTRTIVNIREKIEENREAFQQLLLKELTPESAIIEAWSDRVRSQSGHKKTLAKVLRYGTEDSELEQLIRSTINSRGVTSQSLIQTLLATKSISQDKKNKTIKLLVDYYSPYVSADEPNIVNAAFSAVSNLISTIEYNVGVGASERQFQRQVWTFRLPPTKLISFRRAMRIFLEKVEADAKNEVGIWEAGRYGGDLISAGVGFYYFEEVSSR